jgi:hypothetical protein
MSPIARTSSGTVSAAAIHNRRDMSANSGFESSVAVIVLGSSAIPQIGQDPGPRCTISGCIGQVYGSAEL